MRLLNDGQIIRDTYEVERFLGEGAFAEVYRVRHRFLGRQAMKVFKRTGISFEEITEMLGEAVLLSRIGHPNIVRVFDANVIESEYGVCGYFTMENVPGGSLEKFRHSHGIGVLPMETTLDLMKQVCRGIALAHRESPPIIHRDIKPQNILIGYEGNGLRARASDFGLAKSVNPLTLLATAAGTLAFKPPEVFEQDRSDSCAGDVWAIGTTLYLLLTDQLPYPAAARATWHSADLFDSTVVPPSELNADANEALDRIVLKSLERRPEDRFATAAELLDALEHWQPGHPKPQPEPPPVVTAVAAPAAVSPLLDGDAPTLAARALQAKKEGRLTEAAELMEAAFGKSPGLQEKYARQVKLWRCGITM